MRGFAAGEPSRRLVRAPQRERAGRAFRREARHAGAGSCSRSRSPRRGARRACGRSRSSPSEVDGEPRFRSVPPLLVPLARALRPDRPARGDRLRSRAAGCSTPRSLDEDRRYLFDTYRFVDMARKVVGVGSVGTRAWVFLFVGRDGQDPLVLQVEGGAGLGARALPRRERVRATTANASSAASASRRPRATSSSAGSGARASTARSTTSTSASCGTGRHRSTCRR